MSKKKYQADFYGKHYGYQLNRALTWLNISLVSRLGSKGWDALLLGLAATMELVISGVVWMGPIVCQKFLFKAPQATHFVEVKLVTIV